MSGGFSANSNKRKFNSSSGPSSGGRSGFKNGAQKGGQRTPRSHNPETSKKAATKAEEPRHVPSSSVSASSALASDPNEWFRRLQSKHIKAGRGEKSTVSLALPSSLVRYAQSRELKTYLVGQIARACSMHEVDEIIVFVDSPSELLNDPEKGPSVFVCKLLQYLEAPSYLRKDMFPVNYHLKYAGLLPPLDMPHHMRKDDVSLYREGVVVEGPPGLGASKSLVNIGLATEAVIDYALPAGTRVTVKLSDASAAAATTANTSSGEEEGATKAGSVASRYIPGEPVAPGTPRSEHGLYWGYQVRLAKSFSAVFTESPYLEEYAEEQQQQSSTGQSSSCSTAADEDDGLEMNFVNPSKSTVSSSSSASSGAPLKMKGYDLTIGYSERGSLALDEPDFALQPFKHMLIVFGGVSGIEACIDADETMTHNRHGRNAPLMFDHWLNACPSLGSRVTRTEEAALATLARLRPHLNKTRAAMAAANPSK